MKYEIKREIRNYFELTKKCITNIKCGMSLLGEKFIVFNILEEKEDFKSMTSAPTLRNW